MNISFVGNKKMLTQKNYAGFWKRFVSFIIDKIIISFIGTIILLPVFLVISVVFLNSTIFENYKYSKFTQYSYDFNDNALPEILLIIAGILIIVFIKIVISYFYYALFESSAKQATPGKMIVNLVVVDLNGNRISFSRASGRYFGKILSGIIFYIGYIIAAFTERKQALHDILSGCLVLDNTKISYQSFDTKKEE